MTKAKWCRHKMWRQSVSPDVDQFVDAGGVPAVRPTPVSGTTGCRTLLQKASVGREGRAGHAVVRARSLSRVEQRPLGVVPVTVAVSRRPSWKARVAILTLMVTIAALVALALTGLGRF